MIHYNVAPRYTPGSPASVPRAIAEQVAREETNSIGHALEGIWGEAQKARAEKLGLRGISESVREMRGGWEVHDLITGEKFLRLFPDKLRKLGFRGYSELATWEKAVVDAKPPALDDYQTKGWFKMAPASAEFQVYEPKRITE